MQGKEKTEDAERSAIYYAYAFLAPAVSQIRSVPALRMCQPDKSFTVTWDRSAQPLETVEVVDPLCKPAAHQVK